MGQVNKCQLKQRVIQYNTVLYNSICKSNFYYYVTVTKSIFNFISIFIDESKYILSKRNINFVKHKMTQQVNRNEIYFKSMARNCHMSLSRHCRMFLMRKFKYLNTIHQLLFVSINVYNLYQYINIHINRYRQKILFTIKVE